MAEITLETAQPRVRDLFNRGFAAMEHDNLDYAIDMFMQCIEVEPSFHRARLFLRAAEVKQFRAKGAGRAARIMAQARSMPLAGIAAGLLAAGKPVSAMKKIEQALRIDPVGTNHLKFLARASEAAGQPEVAIQSLTFLRDQDPDNAEVLTWLGKLFLKAGQPRGAQECFERLAELNPHNSDAVKLLKDSMALGSMSKDGWNETASTGGSFRNMIRDTKQATVLEQENKAVRSENDTENLIRENLERIQREPGNINYRRALADLYISLNRFEEGAAALQAAQETAGGHDPQLDNRISQVKLQRFDYLIEQAREAGKTDVADALAKERRGFFFADLQERVGRYPNDLQLHFDYGVALYDRQQVNEAIQQFQLAQRNPQRHVAALYYIGVCFQNKQQYDLAADQLERAAKELTDMNDEKKQVVYALGQVYEAMKKPDKALTAYKQIYSIDIGYKDVAQRVERNYQASS
ncbi:MAG: tetratricopeptide repeat protein [bacterium]